MTRDRVFGQDIEFNAWMRACKELPSYSENCGFVASDVDTVVHRYMTCVDTVGTREMQSMTQLEVKTRGGDLTDSQKDTWFKQHCFSRGVQSIFGEHTRHWGVAMVFLSNTTPDNSEWIEWGRFGRTKNDIRRTRIDRRQLIQVLKFELSPETLKPNPFRRHHKTNTIIEQKTAPLGFTYYKPVTKRS